MRSLSSYLLYSLKFSHYIFSAEANIIMYLKEDFVPKISTSTWDILASVGL